MSQARSGSSAAAGLTLFVTQAGAGEHEVFVQHGLTIGRAESNPICIPDPEVDPIHARILKTGSGQFELVAESSTAKIHDACRDATVERLTLEAGVICRIGPAELCCRDLTSRASVVVTANPWEVRCPRCHGSLAETPTDTAQCPSCELPIRYFAAKGGEEGSQAFRGWLPREVGPYQIRGYVGQGGMGVVLRGVHKKTELPTAVKLPLVPPGEEVEWLRRFEGEIGTLKRLVHPNVVRLQEAGQDANLAWLATDWVDGVSLGDAIKRAKAQGRNTSIKKIRQIQQQLLAGLAYLHGEGVVHRDLKPANVMIGRDGLVKLMDFGLARTTGGDATAMTRTGSVAGTQAYMAPEQMEGEPVTKAVDIYAFGVLWYELLTGRRPAGMFMPPSNWRDDCPPAWEQALSACLSPEPDSRPAAEALSSTIGMTDDTSSPTVSSGYPLTPAAEPLPELPALPEETEAAAASRKGGVPLMAGMVLGAVVAALGIALVLLGTGDTGNDEAREVAVASDDEGEPSAPGPDRSEVAEAEGGAPDAAAPAEGESDSPEAPAQAVREEEVRAAAEAVPEDERPEAPGVEQADRDPAAMADEAPERAETAAREEAAGRAPAPGDERMTGPPPEQAPTTPAAEEPKEAPDEATDTPRPTGEQPAGRPSNDSVLEQAKPAVFQVRSQNRRSHVVGTGTGFVVDDEGFVVTNFHVVQGASAAEAVFEGELEEPIDLEMWAADPELDLALLRLVAGDEAEGEPEWPASLELADDHPRAGEGVWAVGFPKGLGYTVTRGVVNGVRQFEDLPPEMREAGEFGDDSVWVQTDATINSGNSGGPLIREDGRVVGVNTWQWLDGSNLFFALSATHIHELRAAAPEEPLGYAAAGEAYADASPPRGSFPRIEVEQRLRASSVRSVAVSFYRAHECQRCSGSGTVTRRVQVGTRSDGVFQVPIYQDRTEQCSRCDGSGANTGPAMHRLGTQLAERVARLHQEDPSREDALEQVSTNLRNVLAKNPALLQKLVNPQAARMFARDDVVGQPVFAVGRMASDLQLPETEERVHVVQIGGRTTVLSDLQIVDYVRGQDVIVGGLIAGHIATSDGESIPVLQHGFLVSSR